MIASVRAKGRRAVKKDFFVSYSTKDSKMAEWIAQTLENNGYTVIFQQWDFRPGSNFVSEMHKAAREARRTIAVLSPNYIRSKFAHSEWVSAFAKDPQGTKRTLLPILIEKCDLRGLLQQIVHVNLVGVDRRSAQSLILTAAENAVRSPSRRKVKYPGPTKAKPVAGVVSLPRFASSKDPASPADFERVQRQFRALASVHADCDQELFDTLHGFLNGKVDRRHTLLSAMKTVENNIQYTLDRLSLILEAFTGDKTAACIKTIQKKNGLRTKLSDYRMKTEYRDSGSKPDREKFDAEEFLVKQNTITKAIIVDKKAHWGSDNLRKLGRSYKNARSDWRGRYNATLGVGIKAYVSARGAKKPQLPVCGLICVDNIDGHLNNPVCLSFMKEISSRLAVMLYRMRILEIALAKGK